MLLGLAVTLLNGQTSETRQRLAVCYKEHMQGRYDAQEESSGLRRQLASVRERKEILEVKLDTCNELTKKREGGYPSDITDEFSILKFECQELRERTISYEVNELLLKRRLGILDEAFKVENRGRLRAEHALGELEATMRSRILYLELWKQGASKHVERIQAELDESLPAQSCPPELFHPVFQWTLFCRSAISGAEDLKLLREEHVQLIRDNALLRAELTRLRSTPRRAACAQQALDDSRNSRVRSEKMCDVLKLELREAVALAEGRAATAAREGGGGDEVSLCAHKAPRCPILFSGPTAGR